MAKQKVTLRLDADQLAELRALIDPGSLSASVDEAISAHLTEVRHARSTDQWLQGLVDEHGPMPEEATDWAAGVFNEWQATKAARLR